MALLARGRADANRLLGLIASVERAIGDYVERLGLGRSVSTRLKHGTSAGEVAARGSVRAAAAVEPLRAELPPTVAPGAGQKTQGRWTDPDGRVHAEVSGKDEKYYDAVELSREMKARRIPIRASDVEMKLAAHMRRRGIRSATLVVNNIPCEGPLGCDALVPVILPAGSVLTVYGPGGFVRVYRGGASSAWLP